MTNLTITIDSAQVDALLAQLVHRSDHLDPVLTAIGHTISENIRLTFRDLKTPDGAPWAALSPVTVSRRTNHSRVPLNDTGVLRNSIAYRLTGQAVEIGTNAKQAAMMNFGGTKAQFGHLWGNIPARQFMPTEHLPVTWEQDVIDVIEDYLAIR
ncbi:MAG: phage virion morphogenesis protein [Methylococcales bacterium]